MNQQEKIYRWAGFTQNEYNTWYVNGLWHGNTLPPPDLNNLFRWIVPKLQANGYAIEITCYESSGYKVYISHVVHPLDYVSVQTIDDSLSEALANAIEKVIDGGKA